MDNTKAEFLLAIGLFWLLGGLAMLATGYWPSLSGFGVSERFFDATSYLAVAMGCGACLYGRHVYHRGKQQ